MNDPKYLSKIDSQNKIIDYDELIKEAQQWADKLAELNKPDHFCKTNDNNSYFQTHYVTVRPNRTNASG